MRPPADPLAVPAMADEGGERLRATLIPHRPANTAALNRKFHAASRKFRARRVNPLSENRDPWLTQQFAA
jgi:hypothetical protein